MTPATTKTWAVAPYCGTCKDHVTVEVPLGQGLAEFLSAHHACPRCKERTLRLTREAENFRPPREGPPSGT